MIARLMGNPARNSWLKLKMLLLNYGIIKRIKGGIIKVRMLFRSSIV